MAKRVLPLLQLTRMALGFTVVADALAALMLQAVRLAAEGQSPMDVVTLWQWVLVAGVSASLWGFGVSLNDIIDRRRDELMYRGRPLASGRVGIITAYVLCGLLGAVAASGGLALSVHTGAKGPVAVVAFTLVLITLYDTAGKYLAAAGIIGLGLIRFFHAAFPAPSLPQPLLPLLLMTHVVVVMAWAYVLAEKRPLLTRLHVVVLVSSVLTVWCMVLGAAGWVRGWESLQPGEAHWAVLGSVGVFGLISWATVTFAESREAAAARLVFRGLLWLIVYDAAFVWAEVGWVEAGLILLLLPMAWVSSRVMWAIRWGVFLVQRPAYERAGV